MSIRRIESAYATFMDDKRLSGTDMSVLIALAYCANEKNGEACYPSDRYLSGLTHLGIRAIQLARKNLRLQKVVDWVGGSQGGMFGNFSNKYKFLFPQCRMKSGHESYQQLESPPIADVEFQPATPTHDVRTPTHDVRTPPHDVRTPPHDVRTNTEITRKEKSESKSEGLRRLDFEVKFDAGAVDNSGGSEGESSSSGEERGLVAWAMKVCGVTGFDNVRTFSRIMMYRDEMDCREEIMRFESEMRQGEHDRLKNKAAVLTKRLMALPKTSM